MFKDKKMREVVEYHLRLVNILLEDAFDYKVIRNIGINT